jgi:transcriptional regulator with XRE-family HTH domain
MNTFADRLRGVMEEKGMNAYKLAKFLGIPQQTVHRYLKENRIPNGETLLLISEKLEKSCDWLMGKDTEKLLDTHAKASNISVSSEDVSKLIDSHHQLAKAHELLAEAHLVLSNKCPDMHHSNPDTPAAAPTGGGRVTETAAVG